MSKFNDFHDPLEGIVDFSQPDKALYGGQVKVNHCTVKSIKNLTHDTCALTVQSEAGSEPLAHKAGQYATLKVDAIDKPRSYSFARASDSEKPGEYTFFIREVPDGKFSRWLFDKDRCGESITLSGPLGKFGMDVSDAQMICIAGGSGMSAIFAILEDACLRKAQRNVLFLYGARTQKDLYCLDEIKDMQKNWHPDYIFEFEPVLSEEPDDSNWKGARGFVTDYLKRTYLDTEKISLSDAKAFFCGPPPMIDAGVAVLTGLGMATTDIYYDKFEDARSPAPVIDNSKCVLCDECLFVRAVPNCIVEVSKLYKDGNTMRYESVDPVKTSGLYYNMLYIDEKECIRCYACVEACPANAIDPSYAELPLKTLRRGVVS